jgi:hypothetical protein
MIWCSSLAKQWVLVSKALAVLQGQTEGSKELLWCNSETMSSCVIVEAKAGEEWEPQVVALLVGEVGETVVAREDTASAKELMYKLALRVRAYPWILSKYLYVRLAVSLAPLQIIVGIVFRVIICSFVCETA